MKLSLAILVANIAVATAFTNNALPSFTRNAPALYMSSTEVDKVPISITGNNIELTPALVEYVNKRLERPLGKLATIGAFVECDVHLSVNKNPKVKEGHKIEVTTNLKGTTIHSKEENEDMYTAIDAVANRVARKLVKYKERRLEGWHGGKHMGDDLAEALAAIEADEAEDAVAAAADEFVDPEAPKVTKIKSFNLEQVMSVDEAIFALDYIDHDFYVFRNEKTEEINVVYKRNAGGVGLIEPEN
mmetsp:Transcript_14337/g.20186  ORF Transcript_14337/g.20186 Transcript_14337/m.20186 type:complete len:245 (-) Transcript_14337:308-1042(-)